MEKRANTLKKRLTKQELERQRDNSYSKVKLLNLEWKEDWNYPLFPLMLIDKLRWDDVWFQHVNYQLIALELTLEGATRYECDGEIFTARAGECFIILPHSNTRIVNASARGHVRRNLVLLFGGSAPFCLVRLLGLEKDTLLKLPDPAAVENKMREIGDIIAVNGSHERAAAASYDLMLMLTAALRKSAAGIPADMLRVKNYLCENYSAEINIDDVARLSGMSPATLRRKFQHFFGIPPLKYLTRIRMEQAASLLRGTGKSIKETGFDCGFNSALYFAESFRRYFGCTPRQFRQKSAETAE